MPEFNHGLADQILAQVLMHPETHRQTAWRSASECGTTMCMAGWAVELSEGYEHVTESCSCGCGDTYTKAQRPDGSSDFYDLIAAELLGLSSADASALFYTMNDAAAISRLKDFANGEVSA